MTSKTESLANELVILEDFLHEFPTGPTAKAFDRERQAFARIKAALTQDETPSPQPYRLQAFWSPCRKYLVTVHAPPSDITLLDDDNHIWEAAGPEQDANTLGSPFVDRAALKTSTEPCTFPDCEHKDVTECGKP